MLKIIYITLRANKTYLISLIDHQIVNKYYIPVGQKMTAGFRIIPCHSFFWLGAFNVGKFSPPAGGDTFF